MKLILRDLEYGNKMTQGVKKLWRRRKGGKRSM